MTTNFNMRADGYLLCEHEISERKLWQHGWYEVTRDWPQLLWSPHVIGQTIIFSSSSYFFLLLLFIFPRLISAVGDWMSTILPFPHMVWP